MMRVTAVRPLEDCLDGTIVREFVVSEPMDEPAMRRLAAGGALNFYPGFPRPYYRIGWQGSVIQGVIGNHTFRVTLPATLEGRIASEV